MHRDGNRVLIAKLRANECFKGLRPPSPAIRAIMCTTVVGQDAEIKVHGDQELKQIGKLHVVECDLIISSFKLVK